MIDQIKSQIKITKIIEKYIKLQKKGHLYWGLCPFHGEKTPSFVVNDEKQMFHCFGCGISGDIFKFIQLKENKQFSDILHELADEIGIKIKKTSYKQQTNLEEILNKCTEFYQTQLKNEYYQYFIDRKISPEMIIKFQLGYANNNKSIDYLYEFFSNEDLIKAGIITAHSMDRFRNRIIFPIKNRQNNTIGFSGRTIDNSIPKYLNSIETEIFKKSLHLFGEQFLHQMNEDFVILVEGYMDVIKMHQHGFSNTLGIMGTNINRGYFISLFQKFSKVIIMLDGDNAGKKALETNLHILLQSVTPNKRIFIVLLNQKDPDSVLDEFGSEEMTIIINNSIGLEIWINDFILDKYKHDYAIFLEKTYELSNIILNKFIREAWLKLWRFNYNNGSNKPNNKLLINNYTELNLLNIMICNLNLLQSIIDQLFNFSFKTDKYNEIWQYILDNILHLSLEIIKSHIINNYNLKINNNVQIFLTEKTFFLYIQDYFNKINC